MIRITVGLWAAGGSGSVIYTADGGVIWSKQTVPNSWARFFSTDFIDDKKGWIVGEGIHYTTDGGINWSKLNKDIRYGVCRLSTERMAGLLKITARFCGLQVRSSA